jgi:hypothetical protein
VLSLRGKKLLHFYLLNHLKTKRKLLYLKTQFVPHTDNNISAEINNRIALVNRSYFGVFFLIVVFPCISLSIILSIPTNAHFIKAHMICNTGTVAFCALIKCAFVGIERIITLGW